MPSGWTPPQSWTSAWGRPQSSLPTTRGHSKKTAATNRGASSRQPRVHQRLDPTRLPASHLTHTSPCSLSPRRAPCSSPRLPSRKAEPRVVIIMSHLAKQQLTKTRERETGCSTALLGSPGLEVRATDMRSV